MKIEELNIQSLLQDTDFLDEIASNFESTEVELIKDYINTKSVQDSDLIDRFYEWLLEELNNNSKPILTIGWDSLEWGAGGNGFVSFLTRFNIVTMKSSDYENDHFEIFDKETFFPWGIENLENDIVEIESEVFSEGDLLEMANKMGIRKDTNLSVIGKDKY